MDLYFKRMSVLARRPGDTRSYFSQRWRAHGDLVAALPGVRAYVQNHVTGEDDHPDFRVDGFVELWFDSAEAMAAAFASPGARALIEDEPGFLGHATGYNIFGRSALPDSLRDKVICVQRDDHIPALDAGVDPQAGLISHDLVDQILAKPGQVDPPQAVIAFHQFLNGAKAPHDGSPSAGPAFSVRPVRIF